MGTSGSSAKLIVSYRALFFGCLAFFAGGFLVWIGVDGGASEAQQRFHMKVVGPSMVPVFQDGEAIDATPVSDDCHEIQRGDYVVFRLPNAKKHFLKRVYATPGDEVLVDSTTQELLVNGAVITNVRGERFLISPRDMRPLANSLDDDARLVDFAYLVLGENRRFVHDSRVFGAILCWTIDGIVRMDE